MIRGTVLNSDGTPAPGALISILGHPEFGSTLSRSPDGVFDLAVNGGQNLTVQISRSGALPVQRSIDVTWHEFTVLGEVVLTELDSSVTQVALEAGAPAQIHLANPVTDQDGTRRSTLVFPAGTTATLVMPNGSTQAVTSLSIRATEYTVGDNGPEAMPAVLPGTSAYTFAAEFSADEAIAAGATRVQFNQPVYHYLDNFLNFPVGTAIPIGFYDRVGGRWVPGANGNVIRILSVAGGSASIDVTGSGSAATAVQLAALGFTQPELQLLASNFGANQVLWRSPIPHFTTVDGNVPQDSDGDTSDNTKKPEKEDTPDKDKEKEKETCPKNSCCPPANKFPGSSTLHALNQSLTESFPIVGTTYSLNYSSDRNVGNFNSNTLQIPITPSAVSPVLARVDLGIVVAGRQFGFTFPAVPNQTFTFTWDGKDAWGRRVRDPQYAWVEIVYVNQANYSVPFGNPAFAVPSEIGFATPIPARLGTTGSHNNYSFTLGALDARGASLGGMTLSVQHFYDPDSQTLYLGDGTKRRFVESDARNVSLFAGNGDFGNAGIDGPAPLAAVDQAHGLAQLSDGSILIAEAFSMKIVDPNGFIHFYPLTGNPLPTIGLFGALAVSNDSTIFALDKGSKRLYLIQGHEMSVAVPSGVFVNPTGLAAQPDGTVYVLDSGRTIWRIPFGGTPLALPGISSLIGSARIEAIATSRDENDLYLGLSNGRLYRISSSAQTTDLSPEGTAPILQLAIGTTGQPYFMDDLGRLYSVSGPKSFQIPLLAPLTGAGALLVSPRGELYVAQTFLRQVRKVEQTFPGSPAGVISIASEDASEVYEFNPNGLHLRTKNAWTGATKFEFAYDADFRIRSIVDAFGNTTRIERSASGDLTAIVSPDGLVTRLTTNADHYIASLENPNHETHVFGYAPGTGLMTDLRYPNVGEIAHHVFDPLGRLISERDPAGAEQSLTKIPSNTVDGLFQSSEFKTAEGVSTRVTQNIQVGKLSQTRQEADGTSSTLLKSGTTTTFTAADGARTISSLGADPRFGTQASYLTSQQTLYPSGQSRTFEISKTVTENPVVPPNAPSFTYEERTSIPNPFGILVEATRRFQSDTLTWVERSMGGKETVTTLTPSGQPSRISEFGVLPVDYGYDPRGRLTSITQGDRTTLFSYGPSGFLESVQPPEIGPTIYTRDGAGRVVSTLLPDGVRRMLTTYDADGNVTSITPPGKPSWFFDHDLAGNTTQMTPPSVAGAGGATFYHFNRDKKLDRVQRPDGSVIELHYDPVTGNLLTRLAPEGLTQYGYTPGFPKVTSITNPAPAGETQSVQLGYDGGKLTSFEWSGAVNGKVTEEWDLSEFQVSRRIEVGGSAASTRNWFNLDGNVMGSDYLEIEREPGSQRIVRETTVNHNSPSGTDSNVISEFIYNSFGEQIGQVATLSGPLQPTQVVYSEQLTRDRLGRITSMSQTLVNTTRLYEYGYDSAGRLATVRKNGVLTSSYVYDQNGNMVLKQTPTSNIVGVVDDQDRLLSLGNRLYTYNANGEVISVRQSNGQTWSLGYDSQGALIHVQTPSGDSIDYVIDGLGRRVGKKVNGVLQQGYLYDSQDRLLALTDATGAITRTFSYTDQAHSFTEYDFSFSVGGGSPFFVRQHVIKDIRGTPVMVLQQGDGGTLLPRVLGERDEWGNTIAAGQSGFFGAPFGYAGCLSDVTPPSTPFCHFGARDYDPVVGRWLQRDPIGFSGGPNMYGYVLQDPINNIDPSGKVNLVLGIGCAVIDTVLLTNILKQFEAEFTPKLNPLNTSISNLQSQIDTLSQQKNSCGRIDTATQIQIDTLNAQLSAVTRERNVIGQDLVSRTNSAIVTGGAVLAGCGGVSLIF